MASVTTSIVVEFSKGDSDGVLTVEVDDRAEGGNAGNTTFYPGNSVYLLLYKSTNVVIASGTPIASLGSVYATGRTFAVPKTEDITFAGETTASLSYPPINGTFSYSWLGTSYGTISQSGTSLIIPAPQAGTFIAGVARCTYSALGVEYLLTHSALSYSDYSIVVFFSGAVI